MKTNETYTICITYSKNSKNQTPTRHSCYQQGQGKWVKKNPWDEFRLRRMAP